MSERLPDYDLEVLIDTAAEGAWNAKVAHAGGPQFAELERGRRNEIREAALPFIFHGTKALADLGYIKQRTITTIEELEKMPMRSVLATHLGGIFTKFYDMYIESENWEAKGSKSINLGDLPATVLYEPESRS